MRAYLINPIDRTVIEVQHDESNENLYKILDCRTFEIIARTSGLFKGDSLYVDEDARMRPQIPRLGAFSFRGVGPILLGRGLISGHTSDGEMCDPRTPIHKVRDLLCWM